jgi:outer membrane lipoprotein-sorting protein
MPSSKRSWIALLFVVGLALTAGCIEQNGVTTPESSDEVTVELTAEEIYERANDSSQYRTVRGRQKQTVTRNGTTRRVTVAEIWERAPDRTRVELSRRTDTAQSETSTVLVRRGPMLRHYAPTDDGSPIVIRSGDTDRYSTGLAFGSRILSSRWLADAKLQFWGTDSILGRDAYVLSTIASFDTGARTWRLRIWIDQQRFYPLKYTVNPRDSPGRATIEFEEIAFDVPIESDQFTLDDPAPGASVRGVHTGVFDSLAEADFATPGDLPRPTVPNDYELAWARVSSTDETPDDESRTDEHPIVRSKYRSGTDDQLSITWAPNRSVPGGTPLEIERIDVRMVDGQHWATIYRSCDDGHIAVGGSDATRETLVDIAASVDC